MKLPANNLKDAFNACNPWQYLEPEDPRYVDLSAARGSQLWNPVRQCMDRICRSDTPTYQLFAGHMGCGKTTELQRLRKKLEEDQYFVVYFDAVTDLDLMDTEPTDILIAVIRNMEAALRDQGKITLDPKLVEDFFLWFSEVVLEKTQRSEIEAEAQSGFRIEGNIPLLAKLFSTITGRIKTGTESKKVIRQRLDPQISQLIDRGNNLISAACDALKKTGKKLVIIIDSLDRIAPKDRGNGRTAHDVIYIENGNLLRSLQCHLVYTVPISLYFSVNQAHLRVTFPYQYLLPMVKIMERGTRAPWELGRGLMQAILRQRLDVERLFSKGAAEKLVEASGGHPRELMVLVQYALDFTEDPPITNEAVRMAIQRIVNDYGRSIPEEHWPLLARVYVEQSVKNDREHQQMLYNLSVLEYQNDDRWCDVHPAVQALPQFKGALKALKSK